MQVSSYSTERLGELVHWMESKRLLSSLTLVLFDGITGGDAGGRVKKEEERIGQPRLTHVPAEETNGTENPIRRLARRVVSFVKPAVVLLKRLLKDNLQ